MSGQHSRLAPSSMHITEACPGSVQLCERLPASVETEEQAEGTVAHIVAAAALRGDDSLPRTVGYAGREWAVDDDMREGAELFADALGSGCTTEQPVMIDRIHAACWGTPDAWRYDPEARTLVVGDYKYGHRYVDPFENRQLTAYATGIMSHLGVSPGDDETRVEFVIVQPRAFHRGGPVQRWSTTAFGLQPIVKRLREAADAALGPNPPTRTGAHCLDCEARHICGTLRAAVGHVADYSGAADPVELDADGAAVELRILDEAAARLEARRTGLAVQVEAALRNGQNVPGWRLEPGRAKLDWLPDTSVDEVAALGSVLGVNLLKPPALVTPTQAKKAGVPEAIVGQYADRLPAALKLKPDAGEARKIFSK